MEPTKETKVKSYVVLHTTTRWAIPIPETVENNEERVRYAWERVSAITERISKKDVKVEVLLPPELRRKKPTE